MWLVFMAVNSRYGRHHLKDILCSTDSWRGWGSKEFTLPHLLQDMGELVHINRGGVVFSYSLSKNWQEPNLGSGWQEICDDPSSVRSGIVVLESVAPGEHVGWGGTQSRPCSIGSPKCRVVFYHWGGYMLTHIITGLPPYQSTSITAYPMKRSQNLRCVSCHCWKQQWSRRESNSEAGDSSVKGIMIDRYCLVQGTWHGRHAVWVQQSTRLKGILTACSSLWEKQNSFHLTRSKCEQY